MWFKKVEKSIEEQKKIDDMQELMKLNELYKEKITEYRELQKCDLQSFYDYADRYNYSRHSGDQITALGHIFSTIIEEPPKDIISVGNEIIKYLPINKEDKFLIDFGNYLVTIGKNYERCKELKKETDELKQLIQHKMGELGLMVYTY